MSEKLAYSRVCGTDVGKQTLEAHVVAGDRRKTRNKGPLVIVQVGVPGPEAFRTPLLTAAKPAPSH